jgi:hypothetical protein
MEKHVIAAVVGLDEDKPPSGIEPFDDSGQHSQTSPSLQPLSSDRERIEDLAPVSRSGRDGWSISPRTLGCATLLLGGPCGVSRIAFVDQLARVIAAAFSANEYLDFDIKGSNLRLDPFEEQLALAMFAVHGRQRLDEVAHLLLPSFDRRRNECGGQLKKVLSLAISRMV